MRKKILIVGANGYIGSEVSARLCLTHDVVGVDNYMRPFNDANNHWKNQVQKVAFDNWHLTETSYQNLRLEFLEQFDECIWLAGHSSVTQSMKDEYAALNNNLHDLIKFRQKIRCRFIYASSGSVYSRKQKEFCDEQSLLTTPENIYDYTKTSFDHYMEAAHVQGVALRLGTVNGGSKRMRPELMLNSMSYSAKRHGVVKLGNGGAYRPILYLPDLVNAIEAIVNSDIQSGIFNLYSVNMQIAEFAQSVADYFNVPIEMLPNSPTYNFLMNADKFKSTFNFQFQEDVNEVIRGIDSWIED